MRRRREFVCVACVVLMLSVYCGLRFGNRRIEALSPAVDTLEKPIFDVVALNTHLLPPLAAKFAGKRSDADYRCSEIARRLSAYDIVGLSEVFDEKLSAKLIREFNADSNRKFCFARSPPPSSTFQFAGSGLLLLSRFPISAQNDLTFSRGSRFLSTGFQAADGLAAKGAMHVRLKIGPTKQLDCFLVHLESFSRAIRKEQIAELAAFVESNRMTGVPYVLMGDFNVAGPREDAVAVSGEYKELVLALESDRYRTIDVLLNTRQGLLAEGTSDVSEEAGGARIDYIFLGIPLGSKEVEVTGYETMRLLDKRVKQGSLSDHAAIRAQLRIAESN